MVHLMVPSIATAGSIRVSGRIKLLDTEWVIGPAINLVVAVVVRGVLAVRV